MLRDQAAPVAEVHAVVLAYAEAFLLVRSNDVARNVTQQTPVIELALPRFHQIVVGRAIQPERQQAQQRLFGEQAYSAGLKTHFTSKHKPSRVMERLKTREAHNKAHRAVLNGQLIR